MYGKMMSLNHEELVEERIKQLLKENLEPLSAKFLDFLQQAQPIGITARPTPAQITLEANVNGELWPLAEIYCRGKGRVPYGSVWSSCLAKKIREGYPQKEFRWLYDAYRELHKCQGALIGRRNSHLELTPDLKDGKGLRLWGLLQSMEGWIAALEEFLNTVRNRP